MDHSRMAGYDGCSDFFSGEIAEDLSDFRTRPGRANGVLYRRPRYPAWRTLRTGVQRSAAHNIPILRFFGGAGWPRGTRNCADASPCSRAGRIKLRDERLLRPVEILLLLSGGHVAEEAPQRACRCDLQASSGAESDSTERLTAPWWNESRRR